MSLNDPKVYVMQVMGSEAERAGLPAGTYCVWVYPKTPTSPGGAELMFKALGDRTFAPAIGLVEEV